ncbi:cyclin-dependent protein kinase inhibitor SMR3-like [Gossypium australe]|uniref:Cyclin-dependent protein kinase inhibitor SMR3-like n=1 Tax=Gossypium australe TaxID=47621 RepID=A0A5B6UHD0_9ROSI|nr:cyclin-dependent protein kinase inhibitor SMR3-like [Gossypium australe]
MELSFLVRPPLEINEDCGTATNVKQEEEEEKSKLVMMGTSESEVVAAANDDQDENDNDGFKTPTSLDHKILAAAILKCPPAPRKPKSLPIISSPAKRKSLRRRILLDLTKEIESLFPPALIADLGNKIKKI